MRRRPFSFRIGRFLGKVAGTRLTCRGRYAYTGATLPSPQTPRRATPRPHLEVRRAPGPAGAGAAWGRAVDAGASGLRIGRRGGRGSLSVAGLGIAGGRGRGGVPPTSPCRSRRGRHRHAVGTLRLHPFDSPTMP